MSLSGSMRACCAAVLFVTVAATSQSSLAAGVSPTPTPAALKASVTLVGANDANNALSMAVPLGTPLSFILVVQEPPAGHPRGELRVFPFATQGEQPPTIATAKIRTGEGKATTADTAGEPAPVKLDKSGQVPFSLDFDRLRPGKTYKGQLFLTAGELLHHWDISLTTGGRGIVAVDPVGTLKFTKFPFRDTGSFSFTLYDKSEGGPYHHVRVRFEPTTSANSKALTSNFIHDTLSFEENKRPADLEGRGAANPAFGSGVTLIKARTLTAHINPLSPGEYSGILRFGADEASDDAAEAKLPLSIQVRHHWLLPVLVILIGSAFGWFGSKYVVGARRARDLSRQIQDLRNRADFLARQSTPRAGWQFPSEAGSLGFARLGVTLNRLARLTASAMPVILHGDEIEQLRQQTEARLGALESLQRSRLRVEPSADGRPAAQLAIGRLLRSATDLLDRPTFGETEKASLTKILETLETWVVIKSQPFLDSYRQALLARQRSRECPSLSETAGLEEGPIRTQLETLIKALSTEEAIIEKKLDDLKSCDEAIARIALLWRERNEPWAVDLAKEYATGSRTVDDLFQTVDMSVWEALEEEAKNKQLCLKQASENKEKLQTYEVVEIDLESDKFDVPRLRSHPLRVNWIIQPPSGTSRITETDGLTLVQYFPSDGRAEVKAYLRWKGNDDISVEPPLKLEVEPNPEYRKRGIFAGEWTEYMAIVVATFIAIGTAMATLYDSTFGSFAQYVTMFIWAAGAGTGGNLFTQLGTTSAPGGAAATLR